MHSKHLIGLIILVGAAVTHSPAAQHDSLIQANLKTRPKFSTGTPIAVENYTLYMSTALESAIGTISVDEMSPEPNSPTNWSFELSLDRTVPSTIPSPDPEPGLHRGKQSKRFVGTLLFKRLAGDQLQFLKRPKEFSRSDATFLVPFAAFTGLLLTSDHWLSLQLPDTSRQLQQSTTISNYGVYALAGTAAGTFVWGQFVKDDHLKEAGWLSAEAAIDGAAAAYALGVLTCRSRPFTTSRGGFLHSDNSFPSDHAAVAWSLATVIAHEYPGPLTKFLAYGLASTVTVTRVTSERHFASDAFVGTALGWYLGRQVYRMHHDPELGGDGVSSRDRPPVQADGSKTHRTGGEKTHSSRNLASPYEPLDSWIYPAFERLMAMGYVESASLDQRPWTRIECAHLLEEMSEHLPEYDSATKPVLDLYSALTQEFGSEMRRVNGANENRTEVAIASIYTRVTSVTGPALDDGFHFGQTIVNDYGRPYGSGSSSIAGLALEVTAGPLAGYLRAEYQQAPSLAAYSTPALRAIALADNRPFFAASTRATGRTSVLESLVALNIHDFQLSFGKQSAWLGPGRSGSLLLGNNAASFLMLRLERTTPIEIPLISRVLGPMRSEFFLGQLSGQRFIYNGSSTVGPILRPQPFLHGDRVSFKPTSNLEFGMGVVVMFGGPGLPFTWTNFLRTYYLHTSNTATNPGKRFSAFDFTYRIPGLRKWLTLYSDSLAVDEFSPLGSSRPSLNPGLYFPQIPKIQNLEFRIEGLKTSQVPHVDFPAGYVYTDRRYLSGYTNGGELLGSWIGRAGIGGQAWATYHLSARDTLEGSFRHMEVDHSFLKGGHLNDFCLESQMRIEPGVLLTGRIQYEGWAFPMLASLPRRNLTTSFQLAFSPRRNGPKRPLKMAQSAMAGSLEQRTGRMDRFRQ